MAKELGWFVGVLDHRAALATSERFPLADRVMAGIHEHARRVQLDAVRSQDHR
jgi:hypothetical protein